MCLYTYIYAFIKSISRVLYKEKENILMLSRINYLVFKLI